MPADHVSWNRNRRRKTTRPTVDDARDLFCNLSAHWCWTIKCQQYCFEWTNFVTFCGFLRRQADMRWQPWNRSWSLLPWLMTPDNEEWFSCRNEPDSSNDCVYEWASFSYFIWHNCYLNSELMFIMIIVVAAVVVVVVAAALATIAPEGKSQIASLNRDPNWLDFGNCRADGLDIAGLKFNGTFS